VAAVEILRIILVVQAVEEDMLLLYFL